MPGELISVSSFSFFCHEQFVKKDMIVKQFGFRRDEIIKAKLYLGAKTSPLKPLVHTEQSAGLRDGCRAALWPHKPHLSGIRAWETAQMGTTNGLCLGRLQLTNKETDLAAISASKRTRRSIRHCNTKTATIYDWFLVKIQMHIWDFKVKKKTKTILHFTVEWSSSDPNLFQMKCESTDW